MKNQKVYIRVNHSITEVKPKMITTMIKVKMDTRALLQNLKVVERESYDDVIQRLIQHFAEEQLELNEQTRKVILERMNKIQEGKVLSLREVLGKMDKKGKERKNAKSV